MTQVPTTSEVDLQRVWDAFRLCLYAILPQNIQADGVPLNNNTGVARRNGLGDRTSSPLGHQVVGRMRGGVDGGADQGLRRVLPRKSRPGFSREARGGVPGVGVRAGADLLRAEELDNGKARPRPTGVRSQDHADRHGPARESGASRSYERPLLAVHYRTGQRAGGPNVRVASDASSG